MQRIAVAATGAQALAAGLAVADEGGTAVDAALATACVALATEPSMVSFGGGAFVSIWPADGDPVVVDGTVVMPGIDGDPDRLGGGVRQLVTDYGGGLRLHAGLGSVAVPGIIAAFGVAQEQYATMSWSRLVSPAAEAAAAYPMSPAASRYLAYMADSLFGDDPEAHQLVTGPGGEVLAGGVRTGNDLLAGTLTRLAAEGPELFSSGDVGQALVALCQDGDGLITAADLAAYSPVVRPAHRLAIGDWQIATNPPPSVGGPMLAAMLTELAASTSADSWSWNRVIEIQRAVLGYRARVHDFSTDLEADGVALLAGIGELGLASLRGSSSTAHVSAVDEAGNACAITMSSGYGAGMCIPGTGILLNNTLGELELNRLGVHAVPPGTRLASNMAPTTGRTPDGRALAIGSPGADRITTALMQVLGRGALLDARLQEAVDRPRLHVRISDEASGSDTVEFEADPDIRRAVEESGLRGREHPEPHMFFGGVGAAYRHADGRLEAAGDQRREAAVGVV